MRTMKKTGRNAPCPCGSGKKYKLCCLERETEAPTDFPSPRPVMFEDDIDRDSNRVVDLLQAGRIEEAEKAAKLVLEKYPDMPDGLERTAAVLDAKGQRGEAAEYYRRAAEKYEEVDPEHGHEPAEFCWRKARELEEEPPKEG
jgi:tetratricopeptide (TPR) repeat protein